MDDRPPIEITAEQWRIVRDILRRRVPGRPVWAFGSRARRTAKPYSDLDLAIITQTPLTWSEIAELTEDLSDSDLPWRVDVIDWATTSDAFRKIIERDKVVVMVGVEVALTSP